MARKYKAINEDEVLANFQRSKGTAEPGAMVAGQAIELAISAIAAELDSRQLDILEAGTPGSFMAVETIEEIKKLAAVKRQEFLEKKQLASTVVEASDINPQSHVKQFLEERMAQLEREHVALTEIIDNPELYEDEPLEEREWQLKQVDAGLQAIDEKLDTFNNRAARRAKKK